MSHAAAAALGAIAGATIFIGLPVGRIRGISKAVQGILNAVATGVLLFLLWDILSHAAIPIETSLAATRHGDQGFPALILIFAAGVGIGLLGLVYFNARLFGRTKHAPPPAPSPSRPARSPAPPSTTSPRASASPRPWPPIPPCRRGASSSSPA